MSNDTAILSNKDTFTVFAYGDDIIRFKTSKHLEKYTEVLQWDNGYLVVTAKYDNNPDVEEEYIDLIPILENLYFEPAEFLNPIKKVRIENA